MSRKKALAGGLGVLSAALVAGVVLAPAADATQSSHSEGYGVDSAYAISASGLLKVAETPSVDDSEGFSQQSLAELKLPPLADLKVLNAQAGTGRARASVAELSVGLGLGKPALTASAVEAHCGYGKASSSLAKARIGDVALDVQAKPNTAVKVPGLLSVTLNKEVKHKDGSVTVTAISINVDGIQKLDLASATCAAGDEGDGGSTSTPTSTNTPPTSADNGGGATQVGDEPSSDGKAPAPTPVKAHLDVTG